MTDPRTMLLAVKPGTHWLSRFGFLRFWRGAGAVLLLLGAIVVDLCLRGVRVLMVQHALTAAVLGAVLALLVGALVLEAWLDARDRAIQDREAEEERRRWAPLLRPFLDGLMPIVMELRTENETAQQRLGEALEAEHDETPNAQFARAELDMDVEDNIMRGKALTSGQMPWDGRDEALEQLVVLRGLSAQLGGLAATWAGLLAVDESARHLLLSLADAVDRQRDVLEDATEVGYRPERAFDTVEHSTVETSKAVADFIQRYASARKRTVHAVERILQLGEHEYIKRKLAARRWVTYASGEISRRPPLVDPDDDEIPF
jgi:hypothetical protein